MNAIRNAILFLLPLLLFLSGCRTLQSDYAPLDTQPKPTFAPVDAKPAAAFAPRHADASPDDWFTGPPSIADLAPADDLTVARFDPDDRPLHDVDLQCRPGDFTGDRRFDGFVVSLTPHDDLHHPLKHPGGVILELYRFDPDSLSSLGDRLLVWQIPEDQLLPTWDRHAYRFHLTWWKTPPPGDNVYVVMVFTFLSHEGQTFTHTRAPLLISQPRYNK